MDLEKRHLPAELRVEKRAEGSAVIVGHAAVFDQLSEDLGGFREKIAPGAFAETLKAGDDVRALFNHNADYILGRTRSGTLRLEENMHGLAIEIDAPDTQFARDLVLAPMERGDISQMSFAMAVQGQSWDELPDGSWIRTITKVRLYDVSPVTYPAYPQTDVQLARRSLDAALEEFAALKTQRDKALGFRMALRRRRQQLAALT